MDDDGDFEAFVARFHHRLWQAVVPVAGPDAAADAVADAMAWAWEHRDRLTALDNPEGYLYRIAQRQAVRYATRRAGPRLPRPEPAALPEVEPGLLPALEALTEQQRTVVWLVEANQWGLTEVAQLLDVSISTVRNHLARAMAHLRDALEVDVDA